jgi:hypothetical protein
VSFGVVVLGDDWYCASMLIIIPNLTVRSVKQNNQGHHADQKHKNLHAALARYNRNTCTPLCYNVL